MTKFARGRFTHKMSIHTQGITLGRKYRNHLHIGILLAFEGLKLRPFSIFLFISISVNDKIKMYKKEKIKMYKVVHSCYLYLRRDSNGRQLKSTTKYNKSHGIKT